MPRKTLPAHHLFRFALFAVVAGGGWSSAQDSLRKQPPSGTDASASVLSADLVKTGLYRYSSATGNSLLRLSANGMILVDGQLSANCEALQKQVRRISRISDQSIRLLINTDHHLERTGCNTKLLAKGAQVLAHENVKQNLTRYHPPGDPIAPPTRTYDHDFTVKLGGIEVQLMHFGDAHTNGDSVVYFPDLKVVAVGDLYSASPDPSLAEGGSLVGWGAVLAEILKLDFDVVVPGKGPTATRADLAAFKDKMDTLVSRAAGLLKKGVPKERLMAELKTDDLGWSFSFSGERLDHFYDELSRSE